jgi:hypothetical protein
MDRVVGEDHKLDANLEDENLLKYLRGEPSSIKSIDPQVYAQAIEHQLRHAEQDAVFDCTFPLPSLLSPFYLLLFKRYERGGSIGDAAQANSGI